MSETEVAQAVYQCGHCRASLISDDADGWQDWRRCPACGKANRPPLAVYSHFAEATSASELLYIGPDASMSAITVRSIIAEKSAGPLHIPRRETDWPVRRIVLAAAFFACVLFFVFSILGRESTRASVFGIGAIGSLLLLVQPRRRRRF